MENTYRWTTTAHGVNDLEFRFALPSFINKSNSTICFVDAEKFLAAWETYGEEGRMPQRDTATGALVLDGELARYRARNILEKSSEFPAEMPQAFISGSIGGRYGPTLTVWDIDLLITLMQLGVKKIPICLGGLMHDEDGDTDSIATRKLLGVADDEMWTSAVNLEQKTGTDADAIVLANNNFTNAILIKDLSALVNSYGDMEGNKKHEYELVAAQAQAAKPADYDSVKDQAARSQAEFESRYGKSDIRWVMNMRQVLPARYFAPDILEYGVLERQMTEAKTNFDHYKGFDDARKITDVLICAGVHGMALPSQYNSAAIVESGMPIAISCQSQIRNPIGSALELVDRLEATHALLTSRELSYELGKTAKDRLDRLEALIVPLGRAVLNDPQARAIAERELPQEMNDALDWLAANPDADRLAVPKAPEVSPPIGLKRKFGSSGKKVTLGL